MKTLENLLIVKVGTNVLTNSGKQLDAMAFKRIAEQLRDITAEGTGVIVVSSGAITAGILHAGMTRDDIDDVVELQRYAARGWGRVVHHWETAIGADRVSSTLLTKHELHSERTRKKALDVLRCCLTHGDIVVVNENDVISDDEIRFGNNDTLGAELAAVCMKNDLALSVKLLLLTNKQGLNRDVNDDSTLIRTVTDIKEVEQFAGSAENGHSQGGMVTKLHAAKTATSAGVEMYIGHGGEEDVIKRVLAGQTGTRFAVISHIKNTPLVFNSLKVKGVARGR